jgi:hypothetical protein
MPHRRLENHRRFRIGRVPPVLAQCFRPLHPGLRWDHGAYFRVLVRVMAFAWGRRHVANLDRSLDPMPPRTRFNNVFLVARWEPTAALRQKVQDRLRSLRPRTEEMRCLIIADAKKVTRGRSMAAGGTMKAPTPAASIHGHP